jgi:hypothetical protein
MVVAGAAVGAEGFAEVAGAQAASTTPKTSQPETRRNC